MSNKFTVSTIFKAVDHVTKPVARMTRGVTRASRVMHSALSKIARAGLKAGAAIARASVGVAKWGGATVAGMVVAAKMINTSTVETIKLGEALRVSADTLEAFDDAIDQSGYGLEDIINVIKRMNKQLGESGALKMTSATKKALHLLKINFSTIKNLSPEKQFQVITDAIVGMKDETAATSAAMTLMGREAGAVFGVLRKNGQTFDEIVDAYKKINYQTDRSRKGARGFVSGLDDVMTILGTVAKFASGLFGEVVAPELNKIAKWLENNRDEVSKWITEAIERIPGVIETIVDGTRQAITVFKDLIDTISKMGPTLDRIGRVSDRVLSFFDPAEPTPQLPIRMGAMGMGGLAVPSGSPAQIAPPSNTSKTHTTEVTIRDTTGKAEVSKGAKSPGFKFKQTGAF